MEISQIIPHVESLIFAADRPLPVLEITDLLNNAMAFLEDRATLDQVETALEAVREKYSSEFYAFEVRESGGGYQFLTKRDYYQTVAQLNGEKFLKRLSTAALETLAIIAYKQPISKGEIEHIRGVSTDYSIQKLLEKELIVISGRSELLPGKPLLYTTSKAFMDYFGLNSAKDLPKLKEVFDEDVSPTLMLELDENGNTIDVEETLAEDPLNLIVSETGELIEEELSPVIAGVVTDETLEELKEEGGIITDVSDSAVTDVSADNGVNVIDNAVTAENEANISDNTFTELSATKGGIEGELTVTEEDNVDEVDPEDGENISDNTFTELSATKGDIEGELTVTEEDVDEVDPEDEENDDEEEDEEDESDDDEEDDDSEEDESDDDDEEDDDEDSDEEELEEDDEDSDDDNDDDSEEDDADEDGEDDEEDEDNDDEDKKNKK
jgi:segregation and condensation protein B